MSAKKTALAAGIVALGVGVAATGWSRFLGRGQWASPARRMPVVDASGAALALSGGSADERLVAVRDGETLWTLPAGAAGLVRYDLGERRGAARWPLAEPPRQRSAAFLPGAEGRFGYVYEVQGEPATFAAAIGGGDGWLRAPVEVARAAVLHATAWVGPRFEMVFASDAGWEIVSLGAEGAPQRLRVDVVAEDYLRRHLEAAGRDAELALSPSGAHHDGQRWWLQFRAGEAASYAVSETGAVREADSAPEPGALGLLGDERASEVPLQLRRDPDGTLRAPQADAPVARSLHGCLGAPPDAVVELADGHTLVLDPDGHYVELDADFQRARPFGWREHLRAFPGAGASRRPWLLAWVLFGPLAAAAPAAVIAWRQHRRRSGLRPRRWSWPLRLGVGGAALYLLSAGLCLYQLWPFLR